MKRPSLAIVLVTLLAALAIAPALAKTPAAWRYEDVPRVVAIGDVHGAYDELAGLLRGLALVDDTMRWSGGATHLVMLGDLVDRGPRTIDVLDLVMALQEQAPAQGGRVHVILGNHETMLLTRDLRYLHENDTSRFAAEERAADRKAARQRFLAVAGLDRAARELREKAFDERFPPGFFGHLRAFSKDGRYGEWLLAQHIVVVIDGIAFVHGGLAPALLETPAAEINERALEELRDFQDARARLERAGVLAPEMSYAEAYEVLGEIAADPNAPQRMIPAERRLAMRAEAMRLLALHGALAIRCDGPLWYRGSSLGRVETETPLVTAVLGHLGAERAVVGHTPSHTGRVDVRFDGRLIRADTGMLASHYKGRPAAVVFEDDATRVFYAGEGFSSLAVAREKLALGHASDAADWEAFLREASVVAIEQVGAGSTNPERITLARDGEQHRAIFKPIAGDKGALTDDPRREVAAYAVARALGLGLVPPTVLRTINGREGSLQLWVEGAINEEARRAEDLAPDDGARYELLLARQRAFDALIGMGERSDTNLLITPSNWSIHLIDHARAFHPDRTLALARTVAIDDELAARLRAFGREEWRARLAPLLDEARVTAFLDRLQAMCACLPDPAPAAAP